jgi:ketosteroid isomerase-like protein
VDAKERAIRDLYEARERRDWEAVGALLADEVGWHEPGEEDHSGDFQGRDEVVALLETLVAVTDGTFQLEPDGFLNLDHHSAVLVRSWAEREGDAPMDARSRSTASRTGRSRRSGSTTSCHGPRTSLRSSPSTELPAD